MCFIKCIFIEETSKTFIEFNNNINEDICIIYKKNSTYSIDLNSTLLPIYIETNYVKIDSYDKPLKGISTYKLLDLEKMALKMDILLNKKMKKLNIYDAINTKINDKN